MRYYNYISLLDESTAPVTLPTVCLSTWRPRWGPMTFIPMASSRIDRVYHNLSKTISFWPFFRVTFSWNQGWYIVHVLSLVRSSRSTEILERIKWGLMAPWTIKGNFGAKCVYRQCPVRESSLILLPSLDCKNEWSKHPA